nr:PHB depolymerase family esterase [uncultured Gellertiella sp.]
MLPNRQSRDTHLVEIKKSGINPGHLRAWLHVPDLMKPDAPLVVALHGCTQDAGTYAHGSGWSQIADFCGFPVLYPEQQRSNNANLCFNWFQKDDITRDRGELLSIREMIDHVVVAHGIDRGKIFITGLSAGGAMANAMLAAYPDLFEAGAIIGGLPYGTATSVGEAFERMQGRNFPDTADLQALLPSATTRARALPRLSVWHGTHDHTVKPVNAERIVDQWRAAHGLAHAADHSLDEPSASRRVWRDGKGRDVVELYMIDGMGHGVPLATTASTSIGQAGPFMLETGISSTARIARNWGLIGDGDLERFEDGPSPPKRAAGPVRHASPLAGALGKMVSPLSVKAAKRPPTKAEAKDKTGLADTIDKVIHDALRAAGLVR